MHLHATVYHHVSFQKTSVYTLVATATLPMAPTMPAVLTSVSIGIMDAGEEGARVHEGS